MACSGHSSIAPAVPIAHTHANVLAAKDPRRSRAARLGQDLGNRLERASTEQTPGVAAPVVEPVTRVRPAPRYKVFVHNDPVTPMLFVVDVLRGIFGLDGKRAAAVMLEAHTSGIAFVVALTLEQAEFRVEQAHLRARAARYPLTFTYEPE